MSEYQYYEFRAIDQPLDEKAIQALRHLPSRAQITPASFVRRLNEAGRDGQAVNS